MGIKNSRNFVHLDCKSGPWHTDIFYSTAIRISYHIRPTTLTISPTVNRQQEGLIKTLPLLQKYKDLSMEKAVLNSPRPLLLGKEVEED